MGFSSFLTLSRAKPLVPILVVISLLGLILTIIAVACKSPSWTSNEPLSSRASSWVVFGVTVFSTLFAAFVAKALEPLIPPRTEALIQYLEDVATDAWYWRWFSPKTPDPNSSRKPGRKFRFVLSIIIGQLTTSLVATLTPTTVTLTKEYTLEIPGAGYPELSKGYDPASFPCSGAILPEAQPLNLAYRWWLEDDTLFMTRYLGGKDCPVDMAFPLVANINPTNRSIYAYQDSGIAVHPSAMGAPRGVFRGLELSELVDLHGKSVFRTEQCVPVMARNPVTCKPQGSLTTEGDQAVSFNFEVDYDLKREAVFHYRNLSKDSVMLNYLFGETRFTKEPVGKGVMGFSAITDPFFRTPFAEDLARIMNDPNPLGRQLRNYTAVCVVDAQKSFEYRTVTLNLDDRKDTDQKNNNNDKGYLGRNSYTRSLSAGDLCTPEVETVGLPHFAAAMVAQYRPVMEGFPLDGRINSIIRLADSNDPSMFAFNTSKNALEDVLGVIAALGVSTMTPTPGNGTARVQGKVLVDVTGVKLNKVSMSLLLLPPVLTLLTMLWLYWPSLGNIGTPRDYTATAQKIW